MLAQKEQVIWLGLVATVSSKQLGPCASAPGTPANGSNLVQGGGGREGAKQEGKIGEWPCRKVDQDWEGSGSAATVDTNILTLFK